jgi:EAL domain-containing protein (putative c-di-GMP-specific phosphodiesterase class I)/GGDEF domain-containing protein
MCSGILISIFEIIKNSVHDKNSICATLEATKNMTSAYFRVNAIPAFLLVLFTFIVYFFVLSIGDPTKYAISNNDDFKIESAYLLADKSQTLDKILGGQSSFITSQLKDLPWSFDQKAYWIKLTVTNTLDKGTKLVSYFDNPMLDELDIYQLNTANTLINQLHLGDHQQQLTLKQRFSPHYAFNLEANSQSTLYVRIATTGIANTPIHIYQQINFEGLIQKKLLLWGVFFGVLVIIGLYNLVLYYAANDSVYLTYTAYIVSCLGLVGIITGAGFYIFPVQIQLFLNHQVIAVNFLVSIFVLLFITQFLEFDNDKRWRYWLATSTIITATLLLIVSLGIPEYIGAKIFFLFLPLVFIVCFTLIFNKRKSGLRWKRIYIYSWFPLLLSAVVNLLVLTGFIEYSFIIRYAFMVGVLFEIVLMAMALANRMGYQRDQTLFNTTHEISSGLPNMSLLDTNINSLLTAHKEFAVCLIDINNFHSLSRYLERDDVQKLEVQLIDKIMPILNSDSRVNVISNSHSRVLKVAKAKEGTFGFIIASADREVVDVILTTLQLSIFGKMQVSGLLVNLKTRLGVCFALKSAEKTLSASVLIHNALLAINQNKDSGKQIYFYEELKDFTVKKRLSLAQDLQTAIRTNELELYHQPQVDLSNGHIYGSEVLLRWNHSTHGFIPPDLFVVIAEDTGLINELTQWVIEQALSDSQQLKLRGYNAHKISINISGKDVSEPSFLAYVKDKMAQFNVPRNCIIFELTESVMVSDYENLQSLIDDLSVLGIGTSIDDYGTGYSSLTYISQLKFDELKMDKAFILDLDKSTRNLTIVKTTIDMARNLNLKVVGEGVESALIEAKLKESGCDRGQGYYYSKPLPFDNYLSWLEQYNSKLGLRVDIDEPDEK